MALPRAPPPYNRRLREAGEVGTARRGRVSRMLQEPATARRRTRDIGGTRRVSRIFVEARRKAGEFREKRAAKNNARRSVARRELNGARWRHDRHVQNNRY